MCFVHYFLYKYYIYYINKSKDRQTDGRKEEEVKGENLLVLGGCYLTGTEAFKHQIPACQALILLNNKLHFTKISRSGCLIMKNECFWSWNTCSNGSVCASNVRNSVRIRETDFVDNRSICSHLTNAFYKTHNKLSLNAKMKEIRSELNHLRVFKDECRPTCTCILSELASASRRCLPGTEVFVLKKVDLFKFHWCIL